MWLRAIREQPFGVVELADIYKDQGARSLGGWGLRRLARGWRGKLGRLGLTCWVQGAGGRGRIGSEKSGTSGAASLITGNCRF